MKVAFYAALNMRLHLLSACAFSSTHACIASSEPLICMPVTENLFKFGTSVHLDSHVIG